MAYPTINREELVILFRQLMQSDSEFRVLLLLGEAKLGKTHFLTKVFPASALKDYGARCVIPNLRGQFLSAADILHDACGQLGGETAFPRYYAVYRDWMNRPRVAVTGVKALLARVQIKSSEEAEEARKIARHLVLQFAADLSVLADAPCLFLFDALDQASEGVRSWLMDTLLVHLARQAHVRVVVAGRSIPEAAGSYTAISHSHELLPVEEDEAYIDWCRESYVELAEQSIRDFARAFDYKPGLFVDYVIPKFGRRGLAHG